MSSYGGTSKTPENVRPLCYDVHISLTNGKQMTYFDRYLAIATTATVAQVELAVQWYADAELVAHDVARILNARGVNATLEVGASVVSSFSPRQRWNRNVVQALDFAHTGLATGLGNNLRMAQNSLVLGFDALKGLKTNAFARAIAGDENAVTIDVWMCYAGGLDTNSPNKTQYREMSQAVVDVAQEIGLTPRATQALIWIIFRGSAH
jgi:hypothetical protein